MRSSASPVSPHSATQSPPASYPAARSPSSWSTPPPTSPPRHQASSRHATPSGAHPSIASPPRLPIQHDWRESSLGADSTPPSSPSQHAGSRHATPSRTHPSIPIPSYPPLRDEHRHPSLHPGSWSTPPTGPPQQADSRHAPYGPPSAYPSLPPHMPSREEWRQISSQPGHPPPSREATRLDTPAYEPYGQEQQKARKPARTSKLGGIPKDQLQRFRIEDFGTGSSSSGVKRTRSPDGDSQPGAKFMATARKGKAKVTLLLAEEVKQADGRRSKEAGRQQSYRNEIDRAYDELFMAMYGDEEKAKFARAAHGKKGCLKKAVEMLKDIEKEKYALEEQIEALTHSNKVQDAQLAALTHQLRQSQEQMETD